jgi:hypothetical protein
MDAAIIPGNQIYGGEMLVTIRKLSTRGAADAGMVFKSGKTFIKIKNVSQSNLWFFGLGDNGVFTPYPENQIQTLPCKPIHSLTPPCGGIKFCPMVFPFR